MRKRSTGGGVAKTTCSPAILAAETSGDVLHLTLKLANGIRYVDEFLGLKCAVDLLALDVYPNGKEITESAAAYHAATRKLGHRPESQGVTLVAVGDGSTPRTAALFSFRTRWTCWSVDPQLKWEACAPSNEPNGSRGDGPVKKRHLRRLGIAPVTIEAFDAPLSGHVVLAAVHSHASLPVALAKVTQLGASSVDVIANPCCVEQTLGWEPDIAYQDWNIWSPQREVRIWRDAHRTGGVR